MKIVDICTSKIKQLGNKSSKTKHFYVRNLEQWLEVANKKYRSSSELSVIQQNNGIILPPRKTHGNGLYAGGVCDPQFNFLAGFFRNDRENKKTNKYYGIGESYSVLPEDMDYIDETVIFGGVLLGQFGHFISECFARLWYVIKYNDTSTKIAFISLLGVKSWFWPFFDLLGISRDRILIIEKPTQFSKVIIPEESIHSWTEYHDEYLLVYDKLRSAVPVSNKKKIYLTKRQFQDPGLESCNEEYFENFYKGKGFDIVAPEKLSIVEQISILAHADEVVTTLGSVGHLFLFCKPGTTVTILNRIDDDTLIPQCLIHEAKNLNWTFVDASLNLLYATRVDGVSLLGPTRYWKEYVKDKYNEIIEEDLESVPLIGYFEKWVDFYSKPSQFYKVKDLEAFDFISRLYRVIYGRELESSEYNLGYSKKQMSHRINKLETRVNRLTTEQINSCYKINRLEYLEDAYHQVKSMLNTVSLDESQINIINNLDKQLESTLNKPTISYQLHMQQAGWLPPTGEGKTAGLINSNTRIEVIKIDVSSKDIQVLGAVCLKDGGWIDEVSNEQIIGVFGDDPMIGISLRLKSDINHNLDILYRIYDNKNEWSEWKKNGDPIMVEENMFMKAIEIKLINR